MARILILGGGFAAVSAAETMVRQIEGAHTITLVSAGRDFTFYPALVPFVFGEFQPEEIEFDLPTKLSEIGVRFVHGEVLGIDLNRRQVIVNGDDIDGRIHFDYLLVAIGRRLATEQVPGFFEHAHHLLSLEAASKFKHAIEEFDSGPIVVGLCPNSFLPVPVCESALALAEKFRARIESGEVTVTAVFPAGLEKALAGSDLFRGLTAEFERKGIRLVENFPIAEVNHHHLTSTDGDSIPYKLLMLVPPFRGQAPLQTFANVTDPDGFAQVNEHMQIKGFDDIYAAGDIVSLPGPRFGYMAIAQGKTAGRNIAAQVMGLEPDADYKHQVAWIVGERFTDPVFLHYGFWDESIDNVDDNDFFGKARVIRERYGRLRNDERASNAESGS